MENIMEATRELSMQGCKKGMEEWIAQVVHL